MKQIRVIRQYITKPKLGTESLTGEYYGVVVKVGDVQKDIVGREYFEIAIQSGMDDAVPESKSLKEPA